MAIAVVAAEVDQHLFEEKAATDRNRRNRTCAITRQQSKASRYPFLVQSEKRHGRLAG